MLHRLRHLVEDAGCLDQLFGGLLLALGYEPTLSRYSAAVPQCAAGVTTWPGKRNAPARYFSAGLFTQSSSPDKSQKSLRSVASQRLVTSRADLVRVAGPATCGRLARGMEHKVAEIGVQKSPQCTASISGSEMQAI